MWDYWRRRRMWVQHALGRTGDVFMLLEMYILKISTVLFWHGIESSDRCCVTITNHIR
jgi:hypothetical protein